MARFAPLLRALLCLFLLMNGSASAHMAASTALEGAPAAAMLGDDMPAPPCHEDMDTGDMAGLQDGGDHHDAPDAAPDCCKAGSCDGFCTQHAPALVWPLWLGTGAPLHAAAPDYAADGHASARLSHRHRPPILAA
ncbi:MAG TPA: CopL family metal-binding regulatory protein [Pseudoxanthomonas sp.]